MAVKQLPKISDLPEPPDRLVGDQERFDVLTFNSLKAQKKMVNEDLNKTLIPALNEFAVDVNASVDATKASETSALASKNAAASSAATATTKAGEAAASAKAAKTSETSALASKNAASSSATAAANAQKAAEAARDEAQDLANVGYASESHAGLAKVDGKTTRADAGGVITVKDVAIGGNLEDLASARGYLVDEYLPEFPSRTVLSSFDDATTPGNFHVLWNDTTTSAPDGILNKNQYADGVLEVRDNRSASFVSSFARLMQRLTIIGGATRADSARIFVRTQSWGVTREWFPWVELVSYNKFGDGFRNTNGIISVPEYEGATASAAGTSGLVPPATSGQQDSFLTGGGEYKPALTKISDSVSLADSTTAASATAVKSAYDRGTAGVTAAGEAKTTAENALTVANSKQPNLGFTPVQQGGGSGQDNSKIYIGHGTNGLKAQIGTTDLGYIVTTAAGTTKAANSASADRAQVAGSAETLFVTGWGNTKWGSTPYGQSPLYVWCLPSGGSDMMPCSPGVLSAGAANFCTYTPNVRVGTDGSVLPAGGTWRIMTSRNGEGTIMDLAGGSTVSTAGGVFMAIRVA